MTATSNLTSMDLQGRKWSTSFSGAQQPVASIYPSLEHWSSTSFQSPSSHEVPSVSSLVPSSVSTLMPGYKPATTENLYPALPSSFEVTPEPQLSGTSPSGSSDVQDQKTLALPLPSSDTPQDVQHREPSHGGPLEEGSIGLMLLKNVPGENPGMVKKILTWCFDEAQKLTYEF